MKKQSRIEGKSQRITTRFKDHEIKQIKSDMKKVKLSFNTHKSEYIRQRVLA